MTNTTLKTSQLAGATEDVTGRSQGGEQPATKHMQGWALASLTLAFMSICFVLAIDNTILGSFLP